MFSRGVSVGDVGVGGGLMPIAALLPASMMGRGFLESQLWRLGEGSRGW